MQNGNKTSIFICYEPNWLHIVLNRPKFHSFRGKKIDIQTVTSTFISLIMQDDCLAHKLRGTFSRLSYSSPPKKKQTFYSQRAIIIGIALHSCQVSIATYSSRRAVRCCWFKVRLVLATKNGHHRHLRQRIHIRIHIRSRLVWLIITCTAHIHTNGHSFILSSTFSHCVPNARTHSHCFYISPNLT